VARAGTLSLIVKAFLVFPPLAIERLVMFELHLLSFHIMAVALAVSGKVAGLMVTDGAVG